MARTLLLDVDPGCDDAVALVAAVGSDAVDLAGVTTVAGNTTVENATRNALAVLDLVDAAPPVATGCARPLAEQLEPAEHVHGEGGLRGDVPEPARDPVADHAATAIVEGARTHDDLAIAATGPLTNLAVAHATAPDLPELVDEVYVMGGAAFAGGNRTPTAEANFYHDPAAVRRVVDAFEPRVVGLDVTTDARLPGETIERYADAADPAAALVGTWLDYYPEAIRARRGYPTSPQHDAAALAAAVTDAVEFAPYPVEVGASGRHRRGMLVVDRHGEAGLDGRADVAVDLDVDAFRSFLVDSLDAALDGV